MVHLQMQSAEYVASPTGNSIWQAPGAIEDPGGCADVKSVRLSSSVLEKPGGPGCGDGRGGFHDLLQQFLEAQAGSSGDTLHKTHRGTAGRPTGAANRCLRASQE